jgi:hypothetical protein
MGAMRLVPALVFFVLLGVQVLIPSTSVYARCCNCGMSCPMDNTCTCCCCTSPCATEDTIEKDVSYNIIFNNRPLELRGLREKRPVIASEPGFSYIPVRVMHSSPRSAMRLLTIPAGELKFQCERISRLINMLSDFQISY